MHGDKSTKMTMFAARDELRLQADEERLD